jgi:hypothetical protein
MQFVSEVVVEVSGAAFCAVKNRHFRENTDINIG